MSRPLSERELDGFAEHARKGKLECAAVARAREHERVTAAYFKRDAGAQPAFQAMRRAASDQV